FRNEVISQPLQTWRQVHSQLVHALQVTKSFYRARDIFDYGVRHAPPRKSHRAPKIIDQRGPLRSDLTGGMNRDGAIHDQIRSPGPDARLAHGENGQQRKPCEDARAKGGVSWTEEIRSVRAEGSGKCRVHPWNITVRCRTEATKKSTPTLFGRIS